MMKHNRSGLWNRNYIRIFTVNFILLVISNIMGSVFALYVFSLGGTELDVGVCSYLQAFACVIFKPLSGWFLDHRSRRMSLIFSLLLLAVIPIGYIFILSVGLVYLFRFLNSTANAMAATGITTNAYDSLSEDNYADGVGFLGFSNSVANAIAPGIGIWLWDRYGSTGVFGVMSALAILSVFFLQGFHFRQIPEKKRTPLRDENLRSLLYEKAALPAAVLEGFVAFGFGMVSPFLMVFLLRRAVLDSAGMYYTFQACGTFGTRLFVGKLYKKFGETPIVWISAAAFSVGTLLLAFSDRQEFVLLSAVLMGCGYGFSTTGFQILSIRDVSPDRRGAASATYSCSWDIFTALGGLLSGILITLSDYPTVFASTVVVYPLLVLAYLRMNRSHRLG